MKKILSTILVLVMLLSITACTSTDSNNTVSNTESNIGNNENVQNIINESYKLTVNNTEIAVNQNMNDIIDSIGEPKNYFEAPSCAFEGLDKVYTYNGFEIETRPDNENDIINSIRLTDDSIATQENVYIGSSIDEVIRVYGKVRSNDTNYLTYTKGDTTINFIIENGKVIAIEYLPV